MYKALYLSPMIPSHNLSETSSFFQGILGFSVIMDDSQYIILQKDNLTIHILNAGEDIGQMEFYLEVDDLESLWKSMEDKVNGLKVKAPFNRDYSMREIHIAIPQTNTLLFIGQQIRDK